MKLSIIIPCYNEEQTINPLLNSLFSVKFPIEREIIVVDDGSHKNHKEFLDQEIKNNKIKFIRLPKNQGKGVAIRVGLKYASGDVFIIQDADFEYFPEDIPKLLQPILKNQTKVVYGTRFAQIPKDMAKSHYKANQMLSNITNFIYKTKLSDMETGYKLFTREVLDKIILTTREFEFEPEITAQIAINGYNIIEVPIKYHYRMFGAAKINWLDGVEGLLILLKYRFFPKSNLFHFIYSVYKFHMKRIIFRLTSFIAKIIYLRRI